MKFEREFLASENEEAVHKGARKGRRGKKDKTRSLTKSAKKTELTFDCDSDLQDTQHVQEEVISLTGKRKKNNLKREKEESSADWKYGKWTTEEHSRLLEALELFGNSWSLVERHVGTRNKAQIRSHVQKHFIKVRKNIIQELARTDQLKDKVFIVSREYRNCSTDPTPVFNEQQIEVLPYGTSQQTAASYGFSTETDKSASSRDVSGPISPKGICNEIEGRNEEEYEQISQHIFVQHPLLDRDLAEICSISRHPSVEIETLNFDKDLGFSEPYYKIDLPQNNDWLSEAAFTNLLEQ